MFFSQCSTCLLSPHFPKWALQGGKPFFCQMIATGPSWRNPQSQNQNPDLVSHDVGEGFHCVGKIFRDRRLGLESGGAPKFWEARKRSGKSKATVLTPPQ